MGPKLHSSTRPEVWTTRARARPSGPAIPFGAYLPKSFGAVGSDGIRGPVNMSMVRVVLAMLLAASLTVIGAGAAAADSTGHITGTVTGPDGAGLPEIWVTASLYDSARNMLTPVRSAWTRSDGTYDIAGVPAGSYVVDFAPSAQSYFIPEGYDDAATYATATPVEVTAGATTSGKDAQLSIGGRITGTVTGTGGVPLGRVRVTAYRKDGDAWTYVDYWNTNDAGGYTFAGLRPGTYRLWFSDSADADAPGTGAGYLAEYYDDAPSLASATDIVVTAGVTAGGRNARLAPGGHVTGTVTGAGGAPLSGIKVTAYQPVEGEGWWSRISITYTDAAGAYELVGLPTGSVQVGFADPTGAGYVPEFYDDAPTIEKAAGVKVTAGATTSGRDAALAIGGRITGTVTGSGGAALKDVQVSAYRDDGTGWQNVGYSFTDASGGYALPDLRVGTYRLEFQPILAGGGHFPEFYDDAATLATATDVVVHAGGTASGRNAQLTTTPKVTDLAPPPISEPPGPVTATPTRQITPIRKPRLTGRARFGTTLSLFSGTWTPPGATIAIQWLAGPKAVARATSPTLVLSGVLAKRVAGKRIAARITASYPGAAPVTVTLTARGRVKIPKVRR
jgi:5-hydroxyisourate hydrolase-like protein (transthyretin family)